MDFKMFSPVSTTLPSEVKGIGLSLSLCAQMFNFGLQNEYGVDDEFWLSAFQNATWRRAW
jgi:hypothetical protein